MTASPSAAVGIAPCGQPTALTTLMVGTKALSGGTSVGAGGSSGGAGGKVNGSGGTNSASGGTASSAGSPSVCNFASGLNIAWVNFANDVPNPNIATFNTISGTSMAAPHIAGIVAQLFQADPTATPAEIEQALKVSALKFTDGAAYQPGPVGTTSYDKGHGLVDVVAAVAALG